MFSLLLVQAAPSGTMSFRSRALRASRRASAEASSPSPSCDYGACIHMVIADKSAGASGQLEESIKGVLLDKHIQFVQVMPP